VREVEDDGIENPGLERFDLVERASVDIEEHGHASRFELPRRQ
jgi:hypothetical protein